MSAPPLSGRRARPTARGLDLAGAGVVFLLCAWGFGTPALMPVGAGLVAAVVGAWGVVALAAGRLRVVRELVERRPRAGDDVHVDVRLAGGSATRIALRMVDWEIHPGLGALGGARMTRGARGGGRRLRVAGVRRGEHTLAPVRMVVRDPLGLAVAERLCGDAGRVTVVPRTVPAPADAHALGDRRQVHRAALGEDIAHLEGVREYRPGDPLSRVHWGQTAKRGALQTKVFRTDDAGGRIETVLLDIQDVAVAPDDVELAVTAAASVVSAALHAPGSRPAVVHLWAGGEETPVPCTWPDAEARLTRVTRGQGHDLEHMLRRAARLVPPGAGIVGVTTHPTSGLWDAARAARRRGVEAVVVVVGEACAGIAPAASAGVPVVRAGDLDGLTAALAPTTFHGHDRGRLRA